MAELEFCSITFIRAMWGHLISLYDMRPANKRDATVGGVFYAPGDIHEHVRVGLPGDYGGHQPWSEANEKLGKNWDKDYYVVVAESMKANARGEVMPMISKDVACTPLYPERIFVYGEDEHGVDLPRKVILQHLKALGYFGSADLWTPCRPWRGYNRGLPTFNTALRADTQMGPRTLPDMKLQAPYYLEDSSAGQLYRTIVFDP